MALKPKERFSHGPVSEADSIGQLFVAKRGSRIEGLALGQAMIVPRFSAAL
jgi:hypothetical protein